MTTGPTSSLTPSLKRRMASFVYEGLLMFGILLIPGTIGAFLFRLTGHENDTALRTIALLIFAAYFSWFWSRRGQTLPMQTWRIRVVTVQGGALSLARALARFVAACAWFAPAAMLAALNHWTRWQGLAAVGVGVVAYALLALLHPQRQFWHDALCGTRLIDAKPASRLQGIERATDNPAA